MAGDAVRGVQAVIVVDVAGRAGRRCRRCVRSRQREARDTVIKGSSVPASRVVAHRTVRRCESRTCCGVHRIVRLLPLRQMASGVAAICGRDLQAVIVVDVACGAGHVSMSICEQESGGSVVEIGSVPSSRGVAIGAIRQGKSGSGRRVHRVIGLLPRCQVTPGMPAIVQLDLQVVVVVEMAGGARNVGVSQGERKIGRRAGVIEFRSQPAIGGVTRVTIGREVQADMVRAGRLLKINQVARGTSCRQSLELAYCRALVAFLARYRGMRAK